MLVSGDGWFPLFSVPHRVTLHPGAADEGRWRDRLSRAAALVESMCDETTTRPASVETVVCPTPPASGAREDPHGRWTVFVSDDDKDEAGVLRELLMAYRLGAWMDAECRGLCERYADAVGLPVMPGSRMSPAVAGAVAARLLSAGGSEWADACAARARDAADFVAAVVSERRLASPREFENSVMCPAIMPAADAIIEAHSSIQRPDRRRMRPIVASAIGHGDSDSSLASSTDTTLAAEWNTAPSGLTEYAPPAPSCTTVTCPREWASSV